MVYLLKRRVVACYKCLSKGFQKDFFLYFILTTDLQNLRIVYSPWMLLYRFEMYYAFFAIEKFIVKCEVFLVLSNYYCLCANGGMYEMNDELCVVFAISFVKIYES